ncbi:adenylylsulfate kinase [Lewinella marina]|uniref:Adenylyl-sulfate kinase n=1 Tax=Neolewinella marina TaxID=438751 RepID=A0A2G0CGF4_9BACT|nr:adenylyl-sulfate kinase [Neolewinella marina]NJB86546.1 adenylylsulfate kinase [Neolewinella marina]PHK99000.1 adenylyl-sulfate kinase [Neolewinella marina]
MAENIYPIEDQLVQRSEREAANGHRGAVVWLTGLSGSGKSTIAAAAERKLFERGVFARVLDGDNVRDGLNGNLGFSLEDRCENTRRVAEVAKLFAQTGAVVLCSFVSPTRAMRQTVADIVGPDDFLEVFVNTPLEICEQRDVKGLYAKARAGEIKNFTGIDSPYEAPENPFLELRTANLTVEEAANQLIEALPL